MHLRGHCRYSAVHLVTILIFRGILGRFEDMSSHFNVVMVGYLFSGQPSKLSTQSLGRARHLLQQNTLLAPHFRNLGPPEIAGGVRFA